MKLNIIAEALWAGDMTSHDLALAGLEKVADRLQAGPGVFRSDSSEDDEDDDLPYNLSIQGDVGVISIKGSLVNSSSPWVRYYGMTSYTAIREALLAAANHQGVKAILLDITSGGGAVSGLADTAKLVSTIDRGLKPVYSFTDGAMASAAYWLGVSAREVHASNIAMVGSIGVIATHMEYSKALKDEGVGVTVVRSGKYKALANSVEPLTEDGKAQLEAQVKAVDNVFIAHVAAQRGVTVDHAYANMGQGREFVGQAALGAGLVDSITTYDELMGRIGATLARNSQMTEPRQGNHNTASNPMKQALTPTQIAAIAAGADLPAVQAEAGNQAESEANPAAAPASATTPESTPAAEAPAAAAEASAPAQVTQPAEGNNQSAIVDFLRGELRAAQEALASARAEVITANNALTALRTTQDALTRIAAQSLSNMRVALGGMAVDASSMSAEQILADHASAQAQFTEKFKAGGVAAASTPSTPKAPAPVSALSAARRAATGLSSK